MRRRDANDRQSFHRAETGRLGPVIALVLSGAMHAGALLALAAVPLYNASAPPLIRIALLVGGGAGKQDGVALQGEGEARPEAGRKAPAEPVHTNAAAQARRPARISRASRPVVLDKVHARRADPVVPSPDERALALTSPVGFENHDGAAEPSGGGQGVGDGADAAAGSGHGFGTGAGGAPGPRAYCVYCPKPRYPLIARVRGWEGTVEIALSVLADGSVDGASLRRSSGYPALDEAAIAVARESRFRLPSDGKVPAPLRGRIEYRFVLRSR